MEDYRVYEIKKDYTLGVNINHIYDLIKEIKLSFNHCFTLGDLVFNCTHETFTNIITTLNLQNDVPDIISIYDKRIYMNYNYLNYHHCISDVIETTINFYNKILNYVNVEQINYIPRKFYTICCSNYFNFLNSEKTLYKALCENYYHFYTTNIPTEAFIDNKKLLYKIYSIDKDKAGRIYEELLNQLYEGVNND